MKHLLLFPIIFCTSLIFAQQTNETIDVGGTNRTYVQYLPTGFDVNTESLPVVMCLHGLGDVATNIANIGFNQIADTARFIVIYPQGLDNAFGNSSWANGTAFLSSTADDISFFNLLLNDLILNYNADATRIYSTGFSMGGIMSHKLACALNDRIAAIGTMSGTMSSEDFNNCTPAYATPVMHVHGTADGTVPYDGTALPTLELVEPTINFWRNVHGCGATSDSTQLPDTAADGYTVDRFVYQGCTPQASVELWRVNGGDHEYFFEPNNDFTEAVELWLFLRKWSHSNPATASIAKKEQQKLHIYPNPATSKFEIEMDEPFHLEIIDLNGNVVYSLDATDEKEMIDCQELERGVYFLKVTGLTERIVLQ